MRKAIMIVVGVLAIASAGAAQVPGGNIYFGYTYYNTDLSLHRGSLNGFEATLEGKLVPVLGIVADFTGHYGTVTFDGGCSPPPLPICFGPVNANAHQYEVMFGPRVSFPVGKFRPFAELEGGVGHVTTNGFGSDTSFATAIGGGIDYKVLGPVAWRVQADYVHTNFFNRGQGNFRLSTGISVHF